MPSYRPKSLEFVAALSRRTLAIYHSEATPLQRLAAISVGNWDHWIAQASEFPFDYYEFKDKVCVNHMCWRVVVEGMPLEEALKIPVTRRRRRSKGVNSAAGAAELNRSARR